MKKFLFLLAALVICFISCNRHPMEEKTNFSESLIVMQSFLTNNHPKGDTVVFYNESSNLLDTFSVSYSEDLMVIIPKDTNYTDNEELGYIIRDTIAISCAVHFNNDSYSIEVGFSQSEITGELASGAFFEIYQDKRHEERLWADLDLTQLKNKNDYTITNSIGQSCYLRKNEGIISFSDEKGNTWTKK